MRQGSMPGEAVNRQTIARAKFGSAAGKKPRRLSFLLGKFLRGRIDRNPLAIIGIPLSNAV
jgi:hypothetical protein